MDFAKWEESLRWTPSIAVELSTVRTKTLPKERLPLRKGFDCARVNTFMKLFYQRSLAKANREGRTVPDYPKKLIEVALPLDDINREAAREKSIRHGHPSTLHLWWARRPLAAARAVLFAQLVNDPGGRRGYGAKKGQTKADAQRERDKLFDIIRDLVKWENTTNEEVLERARAEIRKSWEETCRITGEDPAKMPPFLDPFCGGGSIPLEAQRLGLVAHGSDLNPVAVMITKALIEIPPKFAGRAPVGPIPKDDKQTAMKRDWPGATGLAEDVRRYGAWMREEAFKRIGHLYPKVKMPKEHGGGEATVIAWLWARTVASSNPALGGSHVPLVSSFWLSTKRGKETWVEPVIDKGGRFYHFTVKSGTPKDADTITGGTKLGRGANFRCILSDTPISPDHIKSEGRAGRMDARLMAIVAEGARGRVYLAPTDEHEQIAGSAKPTWRPEGNVPERLTGGTCYGYGLTKWGDLFTPRQLVALTTFSDLVLEARRKVLHDAKAAGMDPDGKGLAEGGTGATAYADAVGVYLAFLVDKASLTNSTQATWQKDPDRLTQGFSRQAIPMTWDFAEANPLSDAGGGFGLTRESLAKVLERLPVQASAGSATSRDAASALGKDYRTVLSTDPPYYDNIGYADLSDFFYVWLRRSLRPTFPDTFSTILVPKSQELVATPYRHGSREKAETFFLSGMTKAIHNLATLAHPAFPVTIYYAFKQSETDDEATASTGWETFLAGVIEAGFTVDGTWPMRTELIGNLKKQVNALASSIVLVCRRRSPDAQTVSRKQFLRDLEQTLPDALEDMIGGTEGASPIAPVDLAQAAIGPGMGVFSKYAAVLEADGSPMSVRTALTLINKAVDEYFTHVESDMDADTRFAVDWFHQYGFKAGPFGEADVLARARGTSVAGLAESHILESGGGKVRLFKIEEYPKDWDPGADPRVPVWEACHHLIRAVREGETRAGVLLAAMAGKVQPEPIRQLAYRLYTVCERDGRAGEAAAYNELITSWHAIVNASHQTGEPRQVELI